MSIEVLRNSEYSVVGFSNDFAAYGKLNGYYVLEVKSPLFHKVFRIYWGKNKPIFKGLILPTILGLFYSALLVPLWALLYVFIIVSSFYIKTLFESSFITTRYEKVSGVLSFMLSLLGAGFLISLLF